AFGVRLHFGSALLLLPVASIGHIIGLKAHDYVLHNDQQFKRMLGSALILICVIGLTSLV
ncbi:MAG: sulfite exporter TauE/SafE family protein, partial [Gammaproteobacteria bacterium]